MSKNITILNLPIEKYEGLEKIKSILDNLPFEYKLFELDPSITFEILNKLIIKSDLIIIPSHEIWKYYGRNINDLIYFYFKLGGSVIYDVNPNVSEEQNDFLNLFEMKSTNIRLRTRLGYDIPFAMSDHSFKERKIFKSIDQIIMTQPNHIEYWGNSEPILRSNGNFLSIDGSLDLKINFENKLITPIALNENQNEGIFICINGYVKIVGLNNIEDESKNKMFLINLMNYVLSKKSRYELAITEYRNIEEKLMSIIKIHLKIFSNESWIDKIPLNVMDKIKNNLNEENDYEKGLFFIDLKKIIKNNWDIFKDTLDVNNVGKSHSLDWIDYVNEKRKYLVHKAKDSENDGINFEVVQKLKEISSMLKGIISK
jgi:hypothetical protein